MANGPFHDSKVRGGRSKSDFYRPAVVFLSDPSAYHFPMNNKNESHAQREVEQCVAFRLDCG